MDARLSRRGTALVAVGAVVLATAAAVTVGHGGKGDEKDRLPWKARELQGAIQGEKAPHRDPAVRGLRTSGDPRTDADRRYLDQIVTCDAADPR